VTEDEARQRVAGAPVARLATVDATGQPRVQPCCFALDGDVVYSAVDAKPKRSARLARLDDIAANPAVCLVIDHYENDWSRLWWVRLSGQARLVESGPEWERAVDLLIAKYPQYRSDPPKGTVIAVEVDRWASWSGS
jgi:PPOX class probable F420-dependent enzyme